MAVAIQLDWFIDTERLVPPKEVHHSIQTRECQSDELKLSQSKSLFTARNTLNNEPKSLQNHDSLGQEIASRFVTDFRGGNGGKGNLMLVVK